MGWRRLWNARLATKRRRRSILFFVVGIFGWCRRRAFYASRRGASRRGCKLGEDRGTPRGNVFCGWISPGGGCLGLCGGGCVAGRVSGGASWSVSGGR